MREVTTLRVGGFKPHRLPLRDLPLPPDGVVHLWFLDLAALGSPLQPDEAIDRDAFTPRLQRTLRRFYLRLLLGAYLGAPGKDVHISRVIKGKPVLDAAVHDSGLEFSVAGSGGCCLIGVSNSGPVGVDLEWHRREAGRPLALARRYFSGAEAAALEALPEALQDRAFLHTWACKEAVVKAAGLGIANQLCRFTVDVRPDQPPAVLDIEDGQPGQWSLAVCRPNREYFGAIALRNERLTLDGFSLGLAP